MLNSQYSAAGLYIFMNANQKLEMPWWVKWVSFGLILFNVADNVSFSCLWATVFLKTCDSFKILEWEIYYRIHVM